MRFKEWLEIAYGIAKSVEHNPFGSVSEFVICDNKILEITVDGTGIKANYQGSHIAAYDVKYLKSDYTKHKKELDIALENLKVKVAELRKDSDTIYEAIGANQIPKMIISKISGSSGDVLAAGSANLLASELKEKLETITNQLSEHCMGFISGSLIELDTHGISIAIELNTRYVRAIFDKIHITRYSSGQISVSWNTNIGSAIKILANMEVIQKMTDDLCVWLKQGKAIYDKYKDEEKIKDV